MSADGTPLPNPQNFEFEAVIVPAVLHRALAELHAELLETGNEGFADELAEIMIRALEFTDEFNASAPSENGE